MTLWVEKYRPQKLKDIILPKRLMNALAPFVQKNDIPNLILSGSAGIGKTTVARALCNEIDADMIFINGSDERNIDTLRNKIRQFASTVSFGGGLKVVIIDEADYLNANSTQPALRAFIEEFSKNCRFIFTCNNKNKLIDPLQSRCTAYDFTIQKSELIEMCAAFYKRCKYILDEEGVSFDNKALAELIKKIAPDWRQVLNRLQSYSQVGTVDAGILSTLEDASFDKLIGILKTKDFKNMRIWVAQHNDINPSEIFKKLYDCASAKVDNTSIPQLVLILAEWQYKSAMVMDQEINTAACFTEIMSTVKWK